MYRRNKLTGLEAFEDLQMLDGQARLLSQMVDHLDDAEDLKSQVFNELVQSLTEKAVELKREVDGPDTGVRRRAASNILDEIKFVLESHKEVCAVFLPSLSGGGGMAGGGGGMDSGGGGMDGDGGRGGDNRIPELMIDEMTKRAIERSKYEM